MNAGLTGKTELRVHDLRHEAISRVAEAGSNTPGGFSLVDLQHFSGHRDVRMLLRYAHLCTQNLAKRLDAAFSDENQTATHHGVRRLKSGASLTMSELLADTSGPHETDRSADRSLPVNKDDKFVEKPALDKNVSAHPVFGENVIRVEFGRRVA